MSDLPSYIWMRQQWRSFRRILIGALTGVWLVCVSGIAFLRSTAGAEEDGDPEWFWARAALLLLLSTASLVTVWLYLKATREIRGLSELITTERMEQARAAREARDKRPGRRPRGKKHSADD